MGNGGAPDAMAMRGVGTALVTPFRGTKVDYEAFERLIERQVQAGVDFVVPCGTTGESPTLTDTERVAVIERTVGVVAGRVSVVAGTGTNDTPHSVAMTRAARRVGADACLAVSPYYNRPTQEGLYRHFRAMIDDGGLPAMLYHIPSRGSSPIDVETIVRVVEQGGVVGLKETGGVDRITRIRERTAIPILSGDDGLTLPMMALGADGVVSVASNVVPGAIRELVGFLAAEDYPRARQAHERLSPLFRALFCETNPIPVKASLVEAGHLEEAPLRLPLVEASDATKEALREALAHLGAAAVR